MLRVEGWNLWNDHVLGWWKHRDDPNVLFLKYEDLHKVMLQFPLQTAELWPVTAGVDVRPEGMPDIYFLSHTRHIYVLLHLFQFFHESL